MQSRLDPSNVHLQIEALPRQVSVGDELVLSYRLTNTGPDAVESCFTVKDGFSLWGPRSNKA